MNFLGGRGTEKTSDFYSGTGFNVVFCWVLSARRKRKPGEGEVTCPVCQEIIFGSEEETAQHVDACLRQVATETVKLLIIFH